MTAQGRILITRYEDRIWTLLFWGDRLIQAQADRDGEEILGAVYVGKVKNVVKNINAAFVEYSPGKLCFLSEKEARHAILTNRVNDGRLRNGDDVIVQIRAEGIKTKEPEGAGSLAFSGKYLILTTGRKQIGYSSKLSMEEKRRIREYMEKSPGFASVSERYGLVIRTNAREAEDLRLLEREMSLLQKQAEKLLHDAPCRTCFSVLKKADVPYLKNLQDLYSYEYEKIETDDRSIYEKIRAYLEACQPEDLDKLVFYEDSSYPLSKLYCLKTRLSEALARRVWMRSGAYLVVERTEALTCIDVNSGKHINKKDAEESYLQINLEAAEETARQMRLRNLSGIIIVDFINMKSQKNKEALLEHFRKLLKKDPVQADVIDMTPLGLVEVTRKKEKKTLAEQLGGTIL